jgi:hypothetical protein
MQVYGNTYKSPWQALRSIVAKEGVSALYVSYPTTLAMSIPFQSIQFTTYEMLRHKLNPDGGYQPWSHIIAGGIAGGFASVLTNVRFIFFLLILWSHWTFQRRCCKRGGRRRIQSFGMQTD